MDVKNLIGKLHTSEEAPQIPVPPRPRQPQSPVIEDHVQAVQPVPGGRIKMNEDFDGIILDLGEGISLNIPIQRRMSLSDFIKLAEKVKALEMLSESSEYFHKGQY